MARSGPLNETFSLWERAIFSPLIFREIRLLDSRRAIISWGARVSGTKRDFIGLGRMLMLFVSSRMIFPGYKRRINGVIRFRDNCDRSGWERRSSVNGMMDIRICMIIGFL